MRLNLSTNGGALSRPQVDLTFERFRFLAPCQRLRAIVCVLSAHLRRVLKSTCVCLRFREQCLRSEITSVSRVALVLLLRFVAGNMDVNTPASKRSQLIGNTAIVRKRCVIHTNSTCVCWRLSVATFTQKRKDASFDLWPPLADPEYVRMVAPQFEPRKKVANFCVRLRASRSQSMRCYVILLEYPFPGKVGFDLGE